RHNLRAQLSGPRGARHPAPGRSRAARGLRPGAELPTQSCIQYAAYPCRTAVADMSIYEQLGVRTIVNAVGPATRLGGTTLDPEVLHAMAEAASACVPIDELQERVGQLIADITGAEAGYVTSGAAAGLALAAAACMTGVDPTRINRLPDVEGMPHQIIVQRTQRYDYDHALRSVGARLVEVGFPDL